MAQSPIRKAKAIDRYVAARLREARLVRRMSQTKVAQHLGVTFQQLQKYENGVNRISAGKLGMMSALFDVSIVWFFIDAPNMKRTPAEFTNVQSRKSA